MSKGREEMSNQKKYPMAEAVRTAYRAGEEDEALEPLVRVDETGKPVGRISDGDYVIFYDIRGEREIELTAAFTQKAFPHFERAPIKTHWATMIEYASELDVKVAFPPIRGIRNTLPEIVSNAGLRQVKVAETEKAIHVRYFFNGKREEPFPGEKHLFSPSPEVDNYAETPGMSATAVADSTVAAIEDPENDLIVVNFCNTDVLGHIENKDAILTAVNEVDRCVGTIVEAARSKGMTAVITADHGTVEKWLYPDGAIDTGHTDSPVPFIVVDSDLKDATLRQGGALYDVAPTILQLLGLPRPEEMTGTSLISSEVPGKRRRILLVIADGWGARDEAVGNLILEADTPNMDRLQKEWPITRIQAAGEVVGMPDGTVGNSEVGHLHMGIGRRVLSDRVRINQAIEDGSIFENEAFGWAMEGAKRDGTNLHLVGIVSFYSSHGAVEHLNALLEMARRRGVPKVYHHAMLGRRGERPESGAIYIEGVEKETEKLGVGRLVSVIGRFWSLDREENWDRIEKTYRWLVEGKGTPITG
jgi:2,3-bisphosphoglycerate-independent phosphoglycerate mutase